MDRDQIIKALECCCAERFCMCEECPYEGEEECDVKMISDAINLFGELTEEDDEEADQ